MRIIRGLPRTKDRGRVVALGVFDGVHRGHARVLRRTNAWARRLGLPAAVITFDEHPHTRLAPDQRPPRLAPQAQCLQRMKLFGIQEVFVVSFTRRFADIPYERFVSEYLGKRLRVRGVVVGRDFRFGRNGAGDTSGLRRLGKKQGFFVQVIDPLRHHGQIISSSGLRKLVADGRVALARQWLGGPYTLHGEVIRGEGRGATIGLPTANVNSHHEIVPLPGIYAVETKFRSRLWRALCYIGRKPTFHPWGPQTIEVHIPGWRGSLYGKKMELAFIARLRGDRRFLSVRALLAQVERDWKKAQRFWPKKAGGVARIFAKSAGQKKHSQGAKKTIQ